MFVQDDVEVTKGELSDSQSQCSELRKEVGTLHLQIQAIQKLHEEAVCEVSKTKAFLCHVMCPSYKCIDLYILGIQDDHFNFTAIY